MIPRAIGIALALLPLGRALAQLPTDAAAAVALSSEQEKSMAGQARSVSHAAINAVFGAGQGAQPGASTAPPPAAVAPEPAAVAPAPVAGAGEGGAPSAGAPPDGAPANGAPADGTGAADGAPPQVVAPPPNAAALAARGRDPFRPFTLDLRQETAETEILTPLQRYEIPQLRLAAVVLDLKPPRAMLQDNYGMGYIVTPGTPIGRRHGVVKSIESRRVIVEEHVLDYYGREQLHQVVIDMPKEEKPQSTGQE